MQTVVRMLAAFLAAVAATVVLASVASTAFVLHALGAIGGHVPLELAARTALTDAARFGPLYGAFVLIAFIIAFLAAAATTRLAPPARPVIFIAAGGVAMAVMLLAMKHVFFGVDLVAGARTAAGFAAQVLAGAFGGAAFALWTPGPRAKPA